MLKWRVNLILVLIFLFGAAILAQLFFIQVISGNYYKALSQGQIFLKEETEGKRGEIFLKNGEPLAINIDWTLVFASPKEVKEKEETAKKIAAALLLEEAFILEKLKKDNLYEVLKRKLNQKELQILKELNLKGIYLQKESGRYYPQEALASKIVGFLDAEKLGRYGIEEYYDELLSSKGEKRGSDLILTIDYSIQFKAEKLLAEAQKNLDIKEGEIIVVEPFSGKILALANFPNFNPNQYFKEKDFEIFQNGATQKIFEPGSIFKPITLAAAIQEEKITPQTTFVDEGKVKIGSYTIYNYNERIWGKSSMTEVLEKSINTGAVFVEKLLGHNLFLEYLEKFKVFEPSGIDLKEVSSENKELKKGYEINFATASFGQGIELTSIQLVRAYLAIANAGKLIRPYIVERALPAQIFEENFGGRVISPKTASQLTAMLVSVVENGFAKASRIPGYYVAGKTGTAQIAFSALGLTKSGYSEETWQSFVGFAPAFNPQFLILVKLGNPKTKTAEYSAVPIFHDLAKFIIDYYQIPPDYNI